MLLAGKAVWIPAPTLPAKLDALLFFDSKLVMTMLVAAEAYTWVAARD
jgi:hypothetical protein